MHSVEAALAQALALTQRTPGEAISIASAAGRVLREAVTARADVPIRAASMMDGYAVHSASSSLRLRIGAESAAGAPRAAPLPPDEAAPISTGALLPPGADAVIPIEETEVAGHEVVLRAQPVAGAFVRAPGADLRRGEPLLAAGEVLSPTALALAYGEGRTSLEVARRPRVLVVSMGAELRAPGTPLAPGELHDANGPALVALCAASGAAATLAPLVGDDPGALAEVIAASDADLVLTSGGASVGAHDHLRTALARAGGELVLWRVAMKPGKPLVLGKRPRGVLVGLPGNPVSAIVSFHLFVYPMLRAMLGTTPLELPRLRARLDGPLPSAGDRRTYVRARLRWDDGAPIVTPEGRQASSALLALHRAGVLIPVEPGAPAAQIGDVVSVIRLPAP